MYKKCKPYVERYRKQFTLKNFKLNDWKVCKKNEMINNLKKRMTYNLIIANINKFLISIQVFVNDNHEICESINLNLFESYFRFIKQFIVNY